jgi:hypothetical protein
LPDLWHILSATKVSTATSSCGREVPPISAHSYSQRQFKKIVRFVRVRNRTQLYARTQIVL